ncbi:hypothetical protein POG22_07005 [Geitlerinema sp. CS-897]|nr:hypothetical protein [Geitlerinema sp. CS-897]
MEIDPDDGLGFDSSVGTVTVGVEVGRLEAVRWVQGGSVGAVRDAGRS